MTSTTTKTSAASPADPVATPDATGAAAVGSPTTASVAADAAAAADEITGIVELCRDLDELGEPIPYDPPQYGLGLPDGYVIRLGVPEKYELPIRAV